MYIILRYIFYWVHSTCPANNNSLCSTHVQKHNQMHQFEIRLAGKKYSSQNDFSVCTITAHHIIWIHLQQLLGHVCLRLNKKQNILILQYCGYLWRAFQHDYQNKNQRQCIFYSILRQQNTVSKKTDKHISL